MQDAGSREGCMATSQTMMDDGMRDERCAWKGEGGEGGREEGVIYENPVGRWVVVLGGHEKKEYTPNHLLFPLKHSNLGENV